MLYSSSKLLPKEKWNKIPENITSLLDRYEEQRERLCQDKEFIELKMRRLDNSICANIAEWALSSDKSEIVRAYGESLLHQQCGVAPKTKKLGYAIANHGKIKAADQRIIDLICCFFDKSDYVFSHTHYDESSNDCYFRRS